MLRSILGRWGEVSYFEKDEYVGRSLRYYGEYNPDETEMVLSLAQPGKLCLDIGANIGCIAQALEANGFEVQSWEPQPEVYRVLCYNIQGLAHNCALGDTHGVAKMPKIRYSEKNNIGGLSIGTASIFGTIDVLVRTLDSYNFNKPVGFIKLDVEGYEELALRGGEALIKRDRPIIYAEDDRPEKSYSLHNYIRSLDYTIEHHKPMLYRSRNFFNYQKDVWDKPYASHNIICRPC